MFLGDLNQSDESSDWDTPFSCLLVFDSSFCLFLNSFSLEPLKHGATEASSPTGIEEHQKRVSSDINDFSQVVSKACLNN